MEGHSRGCDPGKDCTKYKKREGKKVCRLYQDEKKKQSPGLSSPEFLEVNCRHEIRPIINAGGKINPCVAEAHRLHEEELKKRKEAYNCKIHTVPEDRTKKTVHIQCRNGRPVAMKEIYNGKGV